MMVVLEVVLAAGTKAVCLAVVAKVVGLDEDTKAAAKAVVVVKVAAAKVVVKAAAASVAAIVTTACVRVAKAAVTAPSATKVKETGHERIRSWSPRGA